jgi:CubicO group peptidase (beta-lactamase class C family)
MRSGVAYEERYDFGATPSLAARIHMNAIVANKERFADSAKTITRAADPGSRFNYATLDTAVLGWIVERATKQPLAQFTAANLWGPAGMEADGLWIADGRPVWGRECRAWAICPPARLCPVGAIDAGWRGLERQTSPAQRLDETGHHDVPFDMPSSKGRRGYGFQFWQLDDEPGAYTALGLAGQFIYVHPKTRTVIVKLSHYPQPEPANVMPETLAYFKAITSR